MAKQNQRATAPRAKKNKKTGIFQQIIAIYRATSEAEPKLPWILAGVFIGVFVILLGLGFLLHANIVIWVLWIIGDIIVSGCVTMWTLTFLANRLGFRRAEGQPGAPLIVLNSLTKMGYSFPEQPIWMDSKSQTMIWRGVGRPGVYFIGEGNLSILKREMTRLSGEINRIAPGSDIPIFSICVGNGEGQVPLKKLRRAILRHRVRLTTTELENLRKRLQTIQVKGRQMPRSIDPTRIKISPRTIRRHS